MLHVCKGEIHEKNIIEVLIFSSCCDIILVAGSEGKTFDRNVMPDKTAS